MMSLRNILFFVIIAGFIAACSDLLGTKQDATTEEIFRDGRVDPELVFEDVGYAALTPFWDGFNNPTDVFVGYDELVYVTDTDGLHILDRAGRHYRTIQLRGARAVAMDRRLNVYVAARYDTLVAGHNPTHVWDLPAVYKFAGLNRGDSILVDLLVQPFMDNSMPNSSTQRARLQVNNPNSHENVEITGLAVLADNTLYVSRRGPNNPTGVPTAPDNTVLVYGEVRDTEGEVTGKMINLGQVRSLNPTVPSLVSAVGPSSVTTFVAPPQRDNMTTDLSFLISQAEQNTQVPYRVLWINVVETVNGIEYQPRTSLLAADTTRAERFLYEPGRFQSPENIAVSGDARNLIFVVDSVLDSVFVFQANGFEGVVPPAGSRSTRAINVSFGGAGVGPFQFNNPNGVAYFRRVLYVADTGNNRISRFKLNTDFE